MIESVLQYKEKYEKLGEKYTDFKLPKETWAMMTELRKTLQPCKVATIRMQSDQITLPDIYRYWNICIRETEAVGLYTFLYLHFSFS